MTHYPDYIGIAKTLLEKQAEINALRAERDALAARVAELGRVEQEQERDGICGVTFGNQAFPAFVCTLRPNHPGFWHANGGSVARLLGSETWTMLRGTHAEPVLAEIADLAARDEREPEPCDGDCDCDCQPGQPCLCPERDCYCGPCRVCDRDENDGTGQ